MKKRKQRHLVLIGISRKGEKGFKTLLKSDPEIDLAMLKPTDHINSPDKKPFSESKTVDLFDSGSG